MQTSRCQINIQNGPALSPRSDVSLHLSVRPQENVIVRNHMKNQVWGQEERHGSPISLTMNQSFEITIEVNHSQFRILFNGVYYCNFSNRVPQDQRKFVSISGTCTIAYIICDRAGQAGPTNPIPMPPTWHQPQPPPPPVPNFRPPPPPYPGFYPGHATPAPYTLFQDELKHKMGILRHRTN